MDPRKFTKEDIDKVRGIEGFPIGSDENLIVLSDAPYYTACPNPFIEEFIRENGTPYDEPTDDYHCEPFAADVSEGKTDPIYMAHAYHTKVPYKAIMRYILHYTKPGDIVFDGFCGTGMTGIAAQMCGSDNLMLRLELENSTKNNKWGIRKAILNDLSPVASFISSCFNQPPQTQQFEADVSKAIKLTIADCEWMYKTKHQNGSSDNEDGIINYTVWSDVFICAHCGSELVFGKEGIDWEKGKIYSEFTCPNCGMKLTKKSCETAKESTFDSLLNTIVNYDKKAPILINYSYKGVRYEKFPDDDDIYILEKIKQIRLPDNIPIARMCEGRESRRNDKYGIEYVHQFYTLRNLITLATFSNHLENVRDKIVLTASMMRTSKMYKFTIDRKMGTLSGTLYLPSLFTESNPFKLLERKKNDIISAFNVMDAPGDNVRVQCGSLSEMRNIGDNTIDYIFTDPPFGDNLNYSELSFIWETWLGVITNNQEEAVINSVQNKDTQIYQKLMEKCFSEYYRILKPNRWITVEFHNSKNAVWNAIQHAIQQAGFIVADIRTLDKQQESFKQVNTHGAVKQDLVISAYKPKNSLKQEIMLNAGMVETAWAFVRQHLENIPVVVISNERIEIITERQAFLLYDRMVAYHIMNGISVPIDSTDFYHGLDEKFLKRDGMYFLADQVNEYDTARIRNDVELIQFSMFVTNEKTAISWLYQQLSPEFCGPQTYAEIQPKFMQEVKSVDKFEAMPELSVLLEENFLQDDKGKWYVPDITKEGDVAKLREKKLLKEFEGYMSGKGKLKLFRSEAIRVGFSKLWKDKNYQAIVDLSERLPEQTIQEDPNLLMYYDISLSRV